MFDLYLTLTGNFDLIANLYVLALVWATFIAWLVVVVERNALDKATDVYEAHGRAWDEDFGPRFYRGTVEFNPQVSLRRIQMLSKRQRHYGCEPSWSPTAQAKGLLKHTLSRVVEGPPPIRHRAPRTGGFVAHHGVGKVLRAANRQQPSRHIWEELAQIAADLDALWTMQLSETDGRYLNSQGYHHQGGQWWFGTVNVSLKAVKSCLRVRDELADMAGSFDMGCWLSSDLG